MAHDVFISYASGNKNEANAACATLEQHRIRCWIAPRDIVAGRPYAEAIIDAIASSKLLVLIFSEAANSSEQILREVERAVSKGIPIIPLRIEEVTPTKSMEYFLSAPHWLDALTPPLEEHLERLVANVAQLIDADARQPSEPPPAPPRVRQRRSQQWAMGALLVIGIGLGLGVAWWRPWSSRELADGGEPIEHTSDAPRETEPHGEPQELPTEADHSQRPSPEIAKKDEPTIPESDAQQHRERTDPRVNATSQVAFSPALQKQREFRTTN